MKRVIDDGVNGEPAEGWEEWSRAGWARHVPGATEEFIAGLGEGTIHGFAHATAHVSADGPAVRMGSEWVTHGGLDAVAARCTGRVDSTAPPADRLLRAAPASLRW